MFENLDKLDNWLESIEVVEFEEFETSSPMVHKRIGCFLHSFIVRS